MGMKTGLPRPRDILCKVVNEQDGLRLHPQFGKAAFIAGNLGLYCVELRRRVDALTEQRTKLGAQNVDMIGEELRVVGQDRNLNRTG